MICQGTRFSVIVTSFVHRFRIFSRSLVQSATVDWHMTCGSHCTDLGALNEQPRERALASEKHVVQPLTWTKTMRLIRDAFRALIAQGCASQQETKPSSKPRLSLKYLRAHNTHDNFYDQQDRNRQRARSHCGRGRNGHRFSGRGCTRLDELSGSFRTPRAWSEPTDVVNSRGHLVL